jgi:hypothetical protein
MSADLVRQVRRRPTNERRWESWYKSVYPEGLLCRVSIGGEMPTSPATLRGRPSVFLGTGRSTGLSERHAVAYLDRTCRNLAIDRNARAPEISLEDLVGLESVAAPEQPMGQSLDFNGRWERAPMISRSERGSMTVQCRDCRNSALRTCGRACAPPQKRLREMLGSGCKDFGADR